MKSRLINFIKKSKNVINLEDNYIEKKELSNFSKSFRKYSYEVLKLMQYYCREIIEQNSVNRG